MKISEVVKQLSLDVLSGSENIGAEVTGGYTSDLLSDVMGNIKDGQIWITMQTHKNVLAVAMLREASAVIIVNGNKPDADMLEKAIKEGFPVLATNERAFEISGKLYAIIQ